MSLSYFCRLINQLPSTVNISRSPGRTIHHLQGEGHRGQDRGYDSDPQPSSNCIGQRYTNIGHAATQRLGSKGIALGSKPPLQPKPTHIKNSKFSHRVEGHVVEPSRDTTSATTNQTSHEQAKLSHVHDSSNQQEGTHMTSSPRGTIVVRSATGLSNAGYENVDITFPPEVDDEKENIYLDLLGSGDEISNIADNRQISTTTRTIARGPIELYAKPHRDRECKYSDNTASQPLPHRNVDRDQRDTSSGSDQDYTDPNPDTDTNTESGEEISHYGFSHPMT